MFQVDVKSRREVKNEELADLRIELEQLRQASKLDTYGFVKRGSLHLTHTAPISSSILSFA